MTNNETIRPFSLARIGGQYVVRLTNGKRTLGERSLPTREQAMGLVRYLAGKWSMSSLTVDDLAFNGDFLTGGVLR